ncbi:MAG: hypothetical protein ACYDBH_06450 [Acidobacteriaceae bacterium]
MMAGSPEPYGLDADELIGLLTLLKGIQPPIIIGGQALNLLARHYGVGRSDDLVSIDLDLLGNEEEAMDLARLWQAETHFPTMDEYTPNTAILLVPRQNKPPLTVDVLENVAGVAFGGAIAFLEFQDPATKIHVRVLHPLPCLQSRLWNIYGPLSRRNPREVDRLRLAIQVLHRHLETRLDVEDVRGALNLIERFCKTTVLSRTGKAAWFFDGVDLLNAIPVEHPRLPPEFRAHRWPDLQDHVTRARQRGERKTRKKLDGGPAAR